MLFTNKNKRNTDMVNNLDDSLRYDILTEESYPPKKMLYLNLHGMLARQNHV